ncbi:MAG: multicopper oxidase domain-containing protein [Bacillota bacterium]
MLIQREFWARSGILVLPGGIPAIFWGLAAGPDAGLQMPGPVIEALVGDQVEVTLYNTLNEPVSLTFPGQELSPNPVIDSAGRILSFAPAAVPGGSMTYSFTVSRAGTFHYESGTSPERQVQMGLYGALIVRPTGYDDPADPNYQTAYGKDTSSNYDVEAVIVASEIDPAANSDIAAGKAYDPLQYAPQYWLLNGRPFPDCQAPPESSAQPFSARVRALTGQRILVRLINCGFLHHTFSVQNGPARIIATDAWPYQTAALDATFSRNAVTLGAGQTCDLAMTLPDGESYLYDRDFLHLVNAGAYPGGMMTVVDVRTAFPVTAPAAPSDLTASAAGIGRVDLFWKNNATDEEGLIIERKEDAGGFLRITTLMAGATSYSDENVRADTVYTYRVFAFNAAGGSGYSNEASIATSPYVPPEAPSNLTAAAVSSSRIYLAWQDNATTEDGFRIERRTGASPEYVEIAVLPAGGTNYTDSGLAPATSFTYRICGYNAAGKSGYSNEATAVTLNTIPAAPSNLVATEEAGRRIRLTWTDNATNELGFIVERSLIFDFAFKPIAQTVRDVTQFLDTRVYRGINHYYRVRAYNVLGISSPSNVTVIKPSG